MMNSSRAIPRWLRFTALSAFMAAHCGLAGPVSSAASSHLPLHPVIGPMLLSHGKLSSEKIKASAIRVETIQSDETTAPAELPLALYEEVILQLEKRTGVPIYRDGELTETNIPGLVILHGALRGAQPSHGARQKITFDCRFTDTQGRLLLERDINANLKLVGANLKAAHGIAAKTAKVAHDNFAPAGSPQ